MQCGHDQSECRNGPSIMSRPEGNQKGPTMSPTISLVTARLQDLRLHSQVLRPLSEAKRCGQLGAAAKSFSDVKQKQQSKCLPAYRPAACLGRSCQRRKNQWISLADMELLAVCSADLLSMRNVQMTRLKTGCETRFQHLSQYSEHL